MTDYSNFSATGLFDPYIMGMNKIVTNLLHIPTTIFPDVSLLPPFLSLSLLLFFLDFV